VPERRFVTRHGRGVTVSPGARKGRWDLVYRDPRGGADSVRKNLSTRVVRDLQRLEGWEEVEWHKALDFAEVAEALGVPTDCIMAARNPEGGQVTVFYTPEDSDLENPTILAATLRRGADGVLFLASQPEEQVGMWDSLKADIEGKLRDQFGEPPGA